MTAETCYLYRVEESARTLVVLDVGGQKGRLSVKNTHTHTHTHARAHTPASELCCLFSARLLSCVLSRVFFFTGRDLRECRMCAEEGHVQRSPRQRGKERTRPLVRTRPRVELFIVPPCVPGVRRNPSIGQILMFLGAFHWPTNSNSNHNHL